MSNLVEINDWKPTHTVDEVPVMQVKIPVERRDGRGSVLMPVYIAEDGQRIITGRRRKGIPIPSEDFVAPPVSDYERGFKEGYQKALMERGAQEQDADRTAAEFAVPSTQVREFRTRDVAAAIWAVLGAHDGPGWIVDCQLCEGELRKHLPDGGYHVTARVFDWKKMVHHVFQVKVPERIMLELMPGAVKEE